MTDDLLQRLRALSSENGDIHGQCGSALREAADEIESLRAGVRALHRNGEEAERWKAAIQGAYLVQKNLIARAESAERERDALAKRYADSESNLALCDAALQDVTRERDALRERIANMPIAGESPQEYAARFGCRVVEDGGK